MISEHRNFSHLTIVAIIATPQKKAIQVGRYIFIALYIIFSAAFLQNN